jgi:hypothetical protein
MGSDRRCGEGRAVRALSLILLVVLVPAAHSQAGAAALGPRLSFSDGADDVLLGVQSEFGAVLGPLVLAPGLEWGLGDGDQTLANVDLRWYLLPLPETGIRIYGLAGPGLVLSPESELGFNLGLGAHIPMRAGRRYNVEYRFGLGDLPDHTLSVAILFGI